MKRCSKCNQEKFALIPLCQRCIIKDREEARNEERKRFIQMIAEREKDDAVVSDQIQTAFTSGYETGQTEERRKFIQETKEAFFADGMKLGIKKGKEESRCTCNECMCGERAVISMCESCLNMHNDGIECQVKHESKHKNAVCELCEKECDTSIDGHANLYCGSCFAKECFETEKAFIKPTQSKEFLEWMSGEITKNTDRQEFSNWSLDLVWVMNEIRKKYLVTHPETSRTFGEEDVEKIAKWFDSDDYGRFFNSESQLTSKEQHYENKSNAARSLLSSLNLKSEREANAENDKIWAKTSAELMGKEYWNGLETGRMEATKKLLENDAKTHSTFQKKINYYQRKVRTLFDKLRKRKQQATVHHYIHELVKQEIGNMRFAQIVKRAMAKASESADGIYHTSPQPSSPDEAPVNALKETEPICHECGTAHWWGMDEPKKPKRDAVNNHRLKSVACDDGCKATVD